MLAAMLGGWFAMAPFDPVAAVQAGLGFEAAEADLTARWGVPERQPLGEGDALEVLQHGAGGAVGPWGTFFVFCRGRLVGAAAPVSGEELDALLARLRKAGADVASAPLPAAFEAVLPGGSRVGFQKDGSGPLVQVVFPLEAFEALDFAALCP